MQMRQVLFAAVCDEQPRRYELPEKEYPAPDETDGHNGVGFGSLTWIERCHLDEIPGSNVQVGKHIRQDTKHPEVLETMVIRRRVDFDKIGSEAMVYWRWRRSF